MSKKVSANIWTFEGSTVRLLGMPFPTRMTVIRLDGGDLWVHSPIRLSEPLKEEIGALGNVRYLVAPNKLHHLFISEWITHFPQATAYAPPGWEKKRHDLVFDKKLGSRPEQEWEAEIDQLIFEGSSAMREAVFFHRPSKTLILTDLIENFKPETLNLWERALAGIGGVLYPHGRTPLDWRLSFLFGKKKAAASLATMIGWAPENIIISHGECIFGDGLAFLKNSFSWV